jgi:U4/U6.U5 tri-snRNP component SNU23
MSSSFQATSNVQRQSWDISIYEERAKQVQRLEEQDAKRGKKSSANLSVDTDAAAAALSSQSKVSLQLGNTEITATLNPLGSGFYCAACSKVFRDSLMYLNHCNSKVHKKQIGLAQKPEIATLEQVINRVEYHKNRLLKLQKLNEDNLKNNKEFANDHEEEQEEGENQADPNQNKSNIEQRIDERIRKLEERIEQKGINKRQRLEARREVRLNHQEKGEMNQEESTMSEMMGFSTFK